MTDPVASAHRADDATLLNMVRAGNSGAFSGLYQRHLAAARRLARELVRTPAEVDDAIADTFTRVLDVIEHGGGPADAFRPYVLTVLRQVCHDQIRARRAKLPADDVPEQTEPFADPEAATLESSLITRAYLSLPERSRAVLWHTEIERESPAEAGPVFGLEPSGVSALKRRARDELRQAYLHMYATQARRAECKPVAERLAAFAWDTLSRRDTTYITEHLGRCADCNAAYGELTDIDARLRSVVAPVFLGQAAVSYLSGSGHRFPAAAAAGAAAGAGAAGAAIATGRHQAITAGRGGGAAGADTSEFGALDRMRHSRRRLLAAGVAAAVLAIAGSAWAAVSLAGGHTPPPAAPHHGLAAGPGSVHSSQPQPSHSARSSHAVRPVSAHSPPPSHAPRQSVSAKPKLHSASPSPSPSPSFSLSATIGLRGGHWLSVSFTVTDTGRKSTGKLTAQITLPPGAFMLGGSGSQDSGGGWTCQPDNGGASCQHAAIDAGQQVDGEFNVGLNGRQACGQPVSMVARSGKVSASAKSGDIQCNGGGQ